MNISSRNIDDGDNLFDGNARGQGCKWNYFKIKRFIFFYRKYIYLDISRQLLMYSNLFKIEKIHIFVCVVSFGFINHFLLGKMKI